MTPLIAVPAPPSLGGCPFDPLAEDQLRDPHPWLAQARKNGPVFYVPETEEWWVTGYEGCLSVLRDTATYSSRNVVDHRSLPGIGEALSDGHPMSRPLVDTDPPEHTRLRKLAQKAFTPRAVAEYEPRARELTDGLIDAFIDDRRADLYQQFARPLTIQMICGILGVPMDKIPICETWAKDLKLTEASSPDISPVVAEEVADRVVEFDRWIRAFIEERRSAPCNDLTTSLVAARSDDGSVSLTTWEVERLIVNILSAGIETSATLIGTLVFLLLRDPDRWRRLRSDPSGIAVAAEEALRIESPVRGLRRYVTSDTVLAGAPIPAESTVVMSFASAMRDETAFEDADAFRLDRPDLGRHYGFGKWTHFCLGAPLARLEARVALERLIERVPDLRLADGECLQNREPHPLITALRSLEVVW